MSTKVHECKDHPHFKEKGGWASKSLSSLNPDNTWQSCDLNSEVSDSKALTFFSMPNCLSFMEEPVLGMGDTDTHTHTHVFHSLLLLNHFSRVRLLATPWTAAYQAPPSMGFSRQEYWSGCHCLLFSFASHVQFFATPQTPAHQASLSLTVSRSLPTFMSIDSVMPFNHLFLCCPLLILASIFHSIRVFSNLCVCGLLRWISWIFNKRNPLPFTFGDCMICMIVPRVQCPD